MNKSEGKGATPKPGSGPTHDEIAARAESLWRQKGCPHGKSVEIWLEAEQELLRKAPARRGIGFAPPPGEQELPVESVAEEVEERFPDDTGKEPTSL
jgi:hypothetical protein